MRFCIFLVFLLNLALSKDVRYKIKNSNQQSGNFISVSEDAFSHDSDFQDYRSTRDDTSTVWLQDFEGDLSDWTVEPGWELTEETSYSPTHSFHADDDNFNLLSSIISPIVSVPNLGGENEILKMNLRQTLNSYQLNLLGINFCNEHNHILQKTLRLFHHFLQRLISGILNFSYLVVI